MDERTLENLKKLVEIPSVSSQSNLPVAEAVESMLIPLGFEVETQEFIDPHGVTKKNVIGRRGTGRGGLLYCAHNDVVPVDSWSFPDSGPFEFHQTKERIYGRGSCDMKGSLACFLAAAARFASSSLKAPLSVICTADEEVGFRGARRVADSSSFYRQFVDEQPLTIIGEPTSLKIVHAHKGIYVFRAISKGRAGHSSTTRGINANLKMIPFLQRMKEIYEQTLDSPDWRDERFDPPVISWNIGINDFTYASNITPERSVCTVSFRPMPNQPANDLLDEVRQSAVEWDLELEIDHEADPFFVDPDAAHVQEVLRLAGQERSRTVSYGSDASMFGELQRMLLCGPGNIEQAHTDDEWISLEQLDRGTEFYARLIEESCL